MIIKYYLTLSVISNLYSIRARGTSLHNIIVLSYYIDIRYDHIEISQLRYHTRDVGSRQLSRRTALCSKYRGTSYRIRLKNINFITIYNIYPSTEFTDAANVNSIMQCHELTFASTNQN